MRSRPTIMTTLVVGAFVLAGCQGQESGSRSKEGSNTTAHTSSGELTLSSSNDYGRGAESDGNDTNNQEAPTRILTESTDAIIIYFSRGGNTENVARMIHNANGADMLELTVEDPYPIDYEETVKRADQERDSQNYPALSTELPDLSQYDRVYLGHPIWSMTLANPMYRFLEDHADAINGKSIYPFSTNAGYGNGDSVDLIKDYLPDSTVDNGLSIQDEAVLSDQNRIMEWANQ
ncbi:flavodoxin family protein [Enterococcus sp. AZ109]|uniref:flavodoxin family protein n=1 Tax=Enterococcus sp. AZ109 TaxID=2774634 RepID=UPI003F1F7C23